MPFLIVTDEITHFILHPYPLTRETRAVSHFTSDLQCQHPGQYDTDQVLQKCNSETPEQDESRDNQWHMMMRRCHWQLVQNTLSQSDGQKDHWTEDYRRWTRDGQLMVLKDERVTNS